MVTPRLLIAAACCDRRAGRRRAGEGDVVDPGMRRQRRTRLAPVAGDHVEDASREAGLERQLGDADRRRRGVLGGLHAPACCPWRDRRPPTRAEDLQRIVPGQDAGRRRRAARAASAPCSRRGTGWCRRGSCRPRRRRTRNSAWRRRHPALPCRSGLPVSRDSRPPSSAAFSSTRWKSLVSRRPRSKAASSSTDPRRKRVALPSQRGRHRPCRRRERRQRPCRRRAHDVDAFARQRVDRAAIHDLHKNAAFGDFGRRCAPTPDSPLNSCHRQALWVPPQTGPGQWLGQSIVLAWLTPWRYLWRWPD